MDHKEAFQMAMEALRTQARAEHTDPKRGQLVTRDMCPCGQTTGVGATDKCKALRLTDELFRAIDWLASTEDSPADDTTG